MSDEQRPAEKPTDEWVTGDEPMTGPQASYLETLAREAGEEVPDGLTKAEASNLIDRLQSATGRDPAGEGAVRDDPDAPGNFVDDGESASVPEPNEPG